MGRNSIRKAIGALAIGLALSAQPLTANATPYLRVNGGGILTGADSVQVDGSLYNVRFVDGTCAASFGVCDTAHFEFQTAAGAAAAAQALLDQVFVGAFDSAPASTFGCGSNTVCRSITPYDIDPTHDDGLGNIQPLLVYYTVNTNTIDSIALGDHFLDYDSATSATASNFVFAVWNPAAIPEPGTLVVFAFGLAGLGIMRRRRKTKM